jgi:signal transduction histidine kinase
MRPDAPASPSPSRRAWLTAGGLGLAWLAAVALFALLPAQARLAEATARLEEEGRALRGMVAQRADQHDAHFTSLGALVGTLRADPAAFNEVARGILRFYPRIQAIDVLSLSPSGMAFTTRPACDAACLDALRPAAEAARTGTPSATPLGAGRYLLAKRAAEPGSPLVLTMEVDAARLLEGAPQAEGDGVALLLADGTPVLRRGLPQAAGAARALAFEAELGSASQPFRLRLERRIAYAALVSWPAVAAFALLAAAAAWLAAGLLRSRQAARDARRRAELGEHAARLAHAGRVNALGEMASGIAHEITQPLTALLSGSQAALRLAPRAAPGSPEMADLLAALEANVRQARRAGDILARLRDWSAKELPAPRPLDLNATARGVAGLMGRDFEARGIDLRLELQEPPPMALAEPVQLEQVVHNLLRNAAEAMEASPAGAPRRVTVTTRSDGDAAEVRVADSGPGVPPALRERVFEPFFSTKAQGMGLGLPLCRTLVEAMEGRIELLDTTGGATWRVRLRGAPA